MKRQIKLPFSIFFHFHFLLYHLSVISLFLSNFVNFISLFLHTAVEGGEDGEGERKGEREKRDRERRESKETDREKRESKETDREKRENKQTEAQPDRDREGKTKDKPRGQTTTRTDTLTGRQDRAQAHDSLQDVIGRNDRLSLTEGSFACFGRLFPANEALLRPCADCPNFPLPFCVFMQYVRALIWINWT